MITKIQRRTERWIKYWTKDSLEPICPNCQGELRMVGPMVELHEGSSKIGSWDISCAACQAEGFINPSGSNFNYTLKYEKHHETVTK